MSSTSLIQSPSSKSHTLATPQQLQGHASSQIVSKISATATSVLPSLNLTPRKDAASTPKSGSPAAAGSASKGYDTPGRWQHPRMEEVLRRRDKTQFDARNVKTIGGNAVLIFACLSVPQLVVTYTPISVQEHINVTLLRYSVYAVVLFFAFNIAAAATPLLLTPDTCEDVPLTPSQRHLLGLPPMTRPATPQEQSQYLTPPRYSRSATPTSSSSSMDVQGRGSPLSGKGSPLDGSIRLSGSASGARNSYSGSPSMFSPSPLKEKMLRGGFERRRSSLGIGNGSLALDSSTSSDMASSSRLETPTKKGAGMSLNSKWLYERGRGSPGASRTVLL